MDDFRTQWLNSIGRRVDSASVRMNRFGSQFSRADFHLFFSDVDSPDWFAAQRRLDQVKDRVKSERAEYVNRHR